MSAKTLKSQYIVDRLTDHYKIFMQASYHHKTQQTAIYFRFGPKSKMAAGNKYRKRKLQYLEDRLIDRHEIFTEASCHH